MRKQIAVVTVLSLVAILAVACGTQTLKEDKSVDQRSTPVVESTANDETGAETKKNSGSFVGKSRHTTRGTGSISVDEDGKATVVLGDDFNFDGAPAAVVALGKDGYKKDTILGELKKNKGAQEYEIPSKLEASDYNEVWIWCTEFDVPLGVAKLKG